MRKCEISWTNNYVSATGNSSDQKSNQSRLGFVQQIQTRAGVKTVLPTAQTTLVQHGDHADAELCLWYLDTTEGTRNIDTIDSTKNASPLVQTKRKYKKEKLRPAKNENDGEDEKANHRSSDDETAESNSSNTDCDQDSDVYFMTDTDEEIDTAEIGEEWIEYVKRSTAISIERMKAANIPCWIEAHSRMKWRLAMRIASLPDERWAKKAAE